MQTALQLMETKTGQTLPCTPQTERRSTAKTRMPCWMPWKQPRLSMMPRRSQVLHERHLFSCLKLPGKAHPMHSLQATSHT